jgi:oligoendopeptidase F
LGLYDAYQHDPEGFRAGYDDLLSSTGMAAPATLAARVGINLDAAFWRRGLDVVRGNVEEFERLVEQRALDTMS